MTNFITTLIDNKSQILTLFIQHLGLTILSVILAVLIGVPLGISITKSEKLSKPILLIANAVQAIPSIALLGFLIPFIGIGSPPAVIMVVLYSLLPIIKNTYTGLSNINPDTIECAKGIGLTNKQILKLVKLPLAMPVIMAGIRIASVTAVGLMTIASFVGAGGLGYLVFAGIQTTNNALILSGAIPAAILALVIDFITSRIEKSVTPNGIKSENGVIKKNKKPYISKKVVSIATALIVFIFGSLSVKAYINTKNSITIGSKNYSEQLILGNMYADLVENHTDLKVNRKTNLGGTDVIFTALTSGEVDMYVEYTGTYYMSIMDKKTNSSSDLVYSESKEHAKKKYNLNMLTPIGFNNTYALAIKKDYAKKHNINTISDLTAYSKNLVASPTIEFTTREDGLPGMEKLYGIKFKNLTPVDGGLRYTSINNGKSDVIDAFTTDGLLKAYDLKILEDDKKLFPPYFAAPLVRSETLEKYPELEKVFNMLTNKIDNETMIDLNYQVDKLGKRPEDVARNFLIKQGLI